MVPPGLLLFLVMQELLRLASALLESSSNCRLHLINTFPSRLHKQSPGPFLFFPLPIPSRKTKKKDKCLVLHHLFNTQTTLLTPSGCSGPGGPIFFLMMAAPLLWAFLWQFSLSSPIRKLEVVALGAGRSGPHPSQTWNQRET